LNAAQPARAVAAITVDHTLANLGKQRLRDLDALDLDLADGCARSLAGHDTSTAHGCHHPGLVRHLTVAACTVGKPSRRAC
jgi:hypothetical protein